jgi:hypothetical protein
MITEYNKLMEDIDLAIGKQRIEQMALKKARENTRKVMNNESKND